MLKSIFVTFRGNSEKILSALSGESTWKCYSTPGANRYVQIGTSPHPHSETKVSGGHLGCYWKDTAFNSPKQVLSLPGLEIAANIIGLKSLSEQSISPCSGCLFPRLTFDFMSTELGLSQALRLSYLEIRKHFLGF
jgi:hypothetical protein